MKGIQIYNLEKYKYEKKEQQKPASEGQREVRGVLFVSFIIIQFYLP